MVYVAIYLGLLIFVIGCVRRVIEYASMPRHLRWELYPVPHEEPSRVAHGGSYFETSEWWLKPRHFHMAGELRVMFAEIMFLRGLWEHNRRLWLPSFLFHFGLYLLIGTVVLITCGAAIPLFMPSVGSSSLWVALADLYTVTGYAGAALSTVGAVALLWRRAADAELKNYMKPSDFFNLIFFIVAFGAMVAGYALRPPASAGAGELVSGAIRFNKDISLGRLFSAGLLLASALVAYIPFTHMAHFIAKYFTYHCAMASRSIACLARCWMRRSSVFSNWASNWGAIASWDEISWWTSCAANIRRSSSALARKRASSSKRSNLSYVMAAGSAPTRVLAAILK